MKAATCMFLKAKAMEVAMLISENASKEMSARAREFVPGSAPDLQLSFPQWKRNTTVTAPEIPMLNMLKEAQQLLAVYSSSRLAFDVSILSRI